jgi:hypothetical protein
LCEFADNDSDFLVAAFLPHCFGLASRKFTQSPLGHGSLLAVLLLLGFLLPATSRADSVTAESIWSESNAQQRARSQVPQGAEILGVNCSSVDVRNDLRYRCTVEFNPAQ